MEKEQKMQKPLIVHTIQEKGMSEIVSDCFSPPDWNQITSLNISIQFKYDSNQQAVWLPAWNLQQSSRWQQNRNRYQNLISFKIIFCL